MKAIVIMVNDFPKRVVTTTLPWGRTLDRLIERLRRQQCKRQKEAFLEKDPRRDPEQHPIEVGHVHLHVFAVENEFESRCLRRS